MASGFIVVARIFGQDAVLGKTGYDIDPKKARVFPTRKDAEEARDYAPYPLKGKVVAAGEVRS